MNKKGHPQTLVVAHPGNTNAVKAGVYSTRILEPRIRDLEQEIEALPIEELRVRTLRRELAALTALSEAADQALAQQGLLGRGNQPNGVAQLRLRTHDKLRTTLDAYQEACSPPQDLARAAENGGVEDRVTAQGNLLATLARQHRLPAFGDITPRALNPDAFLEAVIVSRDQAVNNSSRLRARQMLTQRKQARSALCLCFPTRGAEDELEFRDWIEEARDGGVAPHSGDPELAGRVRRFAAGGRLVPWVSYKRQDAAVQASIEAEMRRIKGKRQADDGQVTGADDPTIAPFWEMLLSPDLTQHPVKDRLRALAALKTAGALPDCRCEPSDAYLAEEHADEKAAYIIRLVRMNHWKAAICRVQFPETYLAIRDIAEERIFGDPLYL